MKLLEYHKAFLENTVNLNEARIALLDQRVEAITNYLKASATFSDHFIDVIPQGSYAHKTIIRPVGEADGFDADTLLQLSEIDGWDAKDYVEELYRCFRLSGTYKDMVSRRTRCVKVNYAGDFHIDVVPYLERHGQHYVTNRHKDEFQLTDPERFSEWLDEKGRITGGEFVRVVRLVKYLRDFKNTFSVKSIILSTLLGERVSDGAVMADPDCYKDTPTTLRTVMNSLAAYVRTRSTLPSIVDPAGTGENFGDRWDQDAYSNFRTWMIHYAAKIDAAYLETDKAKSLLLWQEVFGPDFKAPTVKLAESASKSAAGSVGGFRDTEQTLAMLGISEAIDPRYQVRICGRVMEFPGFRAFDLPRSGSKVRPGRRIRFRITRCTVPAPYKVYWKIMNRGPEAERRDCIRGEIFEGGTQWKRDEPTAFRGEHFAECFIVKDGICIAKDRQIVSIT